MNPDAEMVERLNEAEHLYDEVVQQTELHHLHTDAADLLESQSSRIAELERDLAAARDMIRDLCIGHEDNCMCHCCESVFQIDAARKEQAG